MNPLICAALISLSALTSPSFAKPVVLKEPSSSSLSCTSATVTAALANGDHVAFTGCVGPIHDNLVSNQANIDGILANIQSSFHLDLEVLGKSDAKGDYGPFTGNPATGSGTLTFDRPLYGPFVIGLKAADDYSLYAFDTDDLAVVSVQFDTRGTSVNSNGVARDLSHAALFGGVDSFAPPSSLKTPIAGSAPEPGSLALVALGAIGLSARRRRH